MMVNPQSSTVGVVARPVRVACQEPVSTIIVSNWSRSRITNWERHGVGPGSCRSLAASAHGDPLERENCAQANFAVL